MLFTPGRFRSSSFRPALFLVAATIALLPFRASPAARHQAPTDTATLPITPAEIPGIPATLDGDWHWNGAGRQGVLRIEGLTLLLIHGDGTASPFTRPAYDPGSGRVWFDLDDGARVATGMAFGGVMQGGLVSRDGPPYRVEPWCAARAPGCVPGEALPPRSSLLDTAQAAAPVPPPDPPVAPVITDRLTVQVGARRIVAGDTCWVPVWLAGATGLERLGVVIAFPRDEVRPAGPPVSGFLTGGATVQTTDMPGGAVHVGLDRLGGLDGTGTLIQIPFKAVGLSGARAPLDLRIVGATDRQGQRVEVTAISGVLRIVSNASPPAGSPLAGDADGDGVLTANDARLAMKMVSRSEPVRLAADADADGYVTPDDARHILRRVAGPGKGAR